MKRELITVGRGIQLNPTELTFLPQNVDPLHSLLPLFLVIELSSTSFLLIVDRRWIKVHIQLEAGLFLRPKLVLEMGMKKLDQVSDRQERIALDGVRQNGMVEHDAETGILWCTFHD